MCVLCNKAKIDYHLRHNPLNPGEIILGTKEHKEKFTSEEIGVINKLFPYYAKEWDTDTCTAYPKHAHVHILLHRKDFKERNPYNMSLPQSLMDSRRISNLGLYAKEFFKLPKFTAGKILEVGSGEVKNFKNQKKFWGMEYWSLDLLKSKSPNHIIADVENTGIPDNEFDFIFSMDLFEHLEKPWKVAKELSRILKSNGFIFISTLFSWRYHTSPVDYWRFTPHCLAKLFEDLECVEANWDVASRRGIDTIGTQGDGTANDKVPEDHMGAWRENWRVYYVGRKNG